MPLLPPAAFLYPFVFIKPFIMLLIISAAICLCILTIPLIWENNALISNIFVSMKTLKFCHSVTANTQHWRNEIVHSDCRIQMTNEIISRVKMEEIHILQRWRMFVVCAENTIGSVNREPNEYSVGYFLITVHLNRNTKQMNLLTYQNV